MVWQFDESVAKRFQHEATTHIPDYERVIDMCLEYAQKFDKTAPIIDVGSALGHTVDKFVQAGYTNVYGVESSEKMLEHSSHPEKIFLSSQFPEKLFSLVLMNWTLHFLPNKREYLQSIYDNLEDGGTLILTDKTKQSDRVKEMYYNFKRKNGVSDEYILQKEDQLKNYMLTESLQYYIYNLYDIGFKGTEIINSRYGFTTFLCEK
jgi:SAM-dependent methyltransferase